MERGRRAGGASDGDGKESIKGNASFYTDQHGQPWRRRFRIKDDGRRRKKKMEVQGMETTKRILGEEHPDNADQHEQRCMDIEIPRPRTLKP
jgi:hypothetical protein